MFQRRSQYAGVDTASEQHILTVLRFHEARLGKIEKHLVTTNKQLQSLIAAYKEKTPKATSASTNMKTAVDKNSFVLLKTMMENLTNQVVASQTFMKEIKDVVSNIKNPPVVKKQVVAEKPKNDEYYTNHKLLELERDIAKAQLISIGMEPTLDRIDEYVERMRRDRKRFLAKADKEEDSKIPASSNEVIEESEEESEEDGELENVSVSESTNEITLDESVLAQNIENLHKVKEEVEEEVLEAIEKIPVVIKPRKRRGRPKKKH